ncbi:hypothetical protein [Sorangium cellulosum]|uniref:Uncharacterized protein n=1 Tax=Sorangium cellulosum TaxID=56 RepID=A0A150QSA3_SORCE|nr:hypothetical protein [Sorangium cellulosum]KYF70861.1 hypothetical protein BE15_30615 [Sorangium cellulosum]
MPLIRHLDFAQRSLSVAYRASPAPQELVVDVDVAGPPMAPFAPMAMRAVVDAINAGAAGGALFPPAAGYARRLAGPWDEPDGLGVSYRWVLEIAAVAPGFLRNMVEELRRAGMNQPVVRMRIAGALPLDNSPLSVRESQVRSWLDDPRAYLEPWTRPGFPFHVVSRSEGATLRVELAQAIDPPLRQALEDLSVQWLNVIRNYASRQGEEVLFNPHRMLPAFGQGRAEFRAHYPEFLYARDPAAAVLVNMLTRFHERVARIALVEVGL